MLTSFLFRTAHLVQTHPSLRLLLGAILIGLGVVGVIAGGGHGGLIAAGVIAMIGGAAALRGGRNETRSSEKGDEPDSKR